jgi:hypothetical protein
MREWYENFGGIKGGLVSLMQFVTFATSGIVHVSLLILNKVLHFVYIF